MCGDKPKKMFLSYQLRIFVGYGDEAIWGGFKLESLHSGICPIRKSKSLTRVFIFHLYIFLFHSVRLYICYVFRKLRLLYNQLCLSVKLCCFEQNRFSFWTDGDCSISLFFICPCKAFISTSDYPKILYTYYCRNFFLCKNFRFITSILRYSTVNWNYV